jgi:hypothetical protein
MTTFKSEAVERRLWRNFGRARGLAARDGSGESYFGADQIAAAIRFLLDCFDAVLTGQIALIATYAIYVPSADRCANANAFAEVGRAVDGEPIG